MPKFTAAERDQIQSIVANLSITRIPTELIRQHVFNQTGKTLSARSLYYIKQRLKKESYHWYIKLREGEYEYIREFKERINEIVDLQRMHHEIIIKNDNDRAYNPSIIQTSLAELHRLNVTLSKYYDIVPFLTAAGYRQTGTEAEAEAKAGFRISPAGHRTRMPLAENCRCILNGVHSDTVRHIECRSCLHVWCPNALGGQDWCPNPECIHGIKGNEFQPYDENYTWIECTSGCGMWFKTEDILQAHLAACPHSISE